MDFLYTIIIYPLTQIIELIFTFSQKIFREPGISILLISASISVLCLPLYAVAERWQEYERNIQKKLKPKIDKIKSVFSGDERFLILSAYYRQNHYHPIFALRSTFGLLIQIPFFIAAYAYLSNLEALRGVSFLFIADLGRPDAIIPLGGHYINAFPVLMTLINVIAGVVYTRGFPFKDKMQLYAMAAIFLVLLYNSPSGLVIYWTMNNVFSLIKNIYYKINFDKKNTVIFSFLTILCLFLSFYMLTIYKGDTSLRIILSAVFTIIGLFPWIFIILKNILAKTFEGLIKYYSKNKNFMLFLISFIGMWIITGLFLPSMLIASSPQEFSFIEPYNSPLFFVLNTALQAFGFFVFWPLSLYLLFSKKTKIIFALLGLILLFSALCNIFIFPGKYGIISVQLVFNSDINHNFSAILFNSAVLFGMAIIIVLLYLHINHKFFITAVFLCLLSFTGLSVYNITSIDKEFRKMQKFHSGNQGKITEVNPIFHLSRTGKNTIVIMLDRAVSVFIPYIFNESPELNDIYSGFVYYPNTVSFNGYTRMGSPPLFGGYEYTPEEINKRNTIPIITKHNEALLLMPRIFSEAGYSVTVTDPPYPNYSSKDDLRIYEEYPDIKACITDSQYTDIWIKDHNIAFPTTGAIIKRNLFWYSIFRTVPLAFRRGIYLQGDWCAPNLLQKITLTLNGYSVLDYLPQLTGFTPKNENTALFMVNNTTHEASFLQAPKYRPVTAVTNFGTSPFNKETAYHVNAASIKRIADWLIFLKTEGLYDNSRIILVSDHGPEPNFTVKTNLPFNVEQFNPLLLVKDFNSTGALSTDNTFMTNADVPYLALNQQIGEPTNPFTGNKISIEAKDRPLYIAISGSIHLADPMATRFVLDPDRDFYVHKNIFNPNNWERADK